MISVSTALKVSVLVMLSVSYLSVTLNLLFVNKFKLIYSIKLYLALWFSPLLIPIYILTNKHKIIEEIFATYDRRLERFEERRRSAESSVKFTVYLIYTCFKNLDSIMHAVIEHLPAGGSLVEEGSKNHRSRSQNQERKSCSPFVVVNGSLASSLGKSSMNPAVIDKLIQV